MPNAVRRRITSSTAERSADQDETGGVPLGPPVPRAHPPDLSGRTQTRCLPASGRRHARHHSRPCRNRSTGGTSAPMTIADMAEGRATIQIPRWIQLVGLPVLGAARVGARGHARSRDLPLPDRVGDRVPAQPARARRPGAPGAARPRGRGRVPRLRGCSDVRHRRAPARSSSSRRTRPQTGSTPTLRTSPDGAGDERLDRDVDRFETLAATTTGSTSSCATRSTEWLDRSGRATSPAARRTRSRSRRAPRSGSSSCSSRSS